MLCFIKNAERNMSTILFVVLFITLVLQIFSRYFFDMSIVWTEEVSRWLYIYIVMLGASEAVSKRDHITVDLVPNMLQPRGRALLFICIHFIYLLACLYLVKLGYTSTLCMDRLQAITMDIPVSYLYVIIPVGFALMAIRSTINIFQDSLILLGQHAHTPCHSSEEHK